MLARLAVLPLLAAPLAALSSPAIPLSFSRQAASYHAEAPGGEIEIQSTGASLRTRDGSARIKLVHANPQATLSGERDAGIQNRFLGNDPSLWRTGIPLVERVHAHEIYRGIDVVWYGHASRFEYDFLIAPHADPGVIAIDSRGFRDLHIDGYGNLHLRSGGLTLTQLRPVAYQTIAGQRRDVASRFRIDAGRSIRFTLGPYDHSLPLTIDPSLAYSSYLGGAGTEVGQAATLDAQGNFYLLGSTTSTSAGNQHVLLYKIPASGSPVQSIFGGSGTDTGWALVTDSSGVVYMTGSTTSTDFPILGSIEIQASVIGTMKAFLIALSANNSTLLFSVFFGGSYADEARGIALSSGGVLYIVGDTTSPDFLQNFIGTNAFQYSNHGGTDAFLLGISTGALFSFATYIGGSGDDSAYGVAVGNDGSAYIVGTTASADFPVDPTGFAPSFQSANQGGNDAFAIKIVSGGASAFWSTYIGGNNADSANAVAVDSSNNVYIAGTTTSTNFPTSTGAYQTTYQGGNSDGFVIVLPPALPVTGSQLATWGSYVGSTGDDGLNGIAVDSGKNIWLIGVTDSTVFPVSSDATQTASGGANDAIVSELNNAGTSLLFSTYLGGTGNEVGNGIAINSTGIVYIAGTTTSSNNDFPLVGAAQKTYGGGASDAFISTFGCPDTAPVITTASVGNAGSFSTSTISPGGIIAIFGSNMACAALSATAVPLATTLGGVTVKVNATPVPLFYVSGSQVNAQLPYDTPVGTATISVTGPGGTSAGASIAVVEAGPGLFVVGTQAAALNQDGTLNTLTNGAKPGSIVTVYFTGQGPLDNAIATGAAAPTSPLSRTSTTATASLAGSNATLEFIGMTPGFVGLAQANIIVPSNLSAGTYPVILTINGVASQPANITVAN